MPRSDRTLRLTATARTPRGDAHARRTAELPHPDFVRRARPYSRASCACGGDLARDYFIGSTETATACVYVTSTLSPAFILPS
jgi:hypothetical protein